MPVRGTFLAGDPEIQRRPRSHTDSGFTDACPALDRLRERTARLFDLYELGQLDKALFQERMAGLSVERDRLTARLKVRVPPDGARNMPEATAAAGGVVKVVVQDRRAQVHMADEAVSDVSLGSETRQQRSEEDSADGG